MKFKLMELKKYHDKNSMEDLKKFGFSFKMVENTGTIFDGYYERLDFHVDIEIDSLEKLIELSDEYGLIIDGDHLTLHNDYLG